MSDPEQEAAGARWAEDLILELGEYAPMELLIRARRLGYPDYERWRRGEVASLAECLRGNPSRVTALLSGARAHCQRRRLEAREDVWTAWGDERQGLTLAHDPELSALLSTRYAPPDDRIQGDLFENSGVTVLAADVVRALKAGDREAARRSLERLTERQPDHPYLGAYERLVAGLNVPEAIESPSEWLQAVVDELEPAAREHLGSGYRDYLAPHWEALRRALIGRAFDPAEPRLHASYVAHRRGDARAVIEAVTADPEWRNQPILLARLLSAARDVGDNDRLLEAACRLCWDHPEAAPAELDRDPGLRTAWRAFDELDFDPPLATADFPAWYALAYDRPLPGLDAVANESARACAEAATAVVRHRPERDERAHLEARQRLQALEPRLLQLYLGLQRRTALRRSGPGWAQP